MQNFIKRIPIEDGFNPEFFFNKIYTVNGDRYYVSVLDKKRISHHFSMEQTDGIWRVSDNRQVADWIRSVEPELGKAILQSISPNT